MYQTRQPGRGIGSEMVSKAVDAVGADKINTISGRLELDNKAAFNRAFEKGATPEQAALQTPLGKAASRLGFTQVKVMPPPKPGQGPNVTFSKE